MPRLLQRNQRAIASTVDAEQRGMTWEAAVARADQAVCLAQAGRLQEAGAAAARARAALPQVHDAYSRALIQGSLGEVSHRLGALDDAAALAAESQRCWALDRAYCERLRCALEQRGSLLS